MKTFIILSAVVILYLSTKLIFQKDPAKRDFILFWQKQASLKSEGTQRCYLNSLNHFKKFVKTDSFPIRKVDEELMLTFRQHLLEGCKKQNTASSIFGNAKTIVSTAERWRLIKVPIIVDRIALIHSPKDFLTTREIGRLARTDCENLEVKRAFLFACISGLRISDIREVKYLNLIKKRGKYYLSIVMHKTKQPIYNELNDVVRNILTTKHDNNDLIFPELPKDNVSVNRCLRKWVEDAGIDKHITMQNGRFTYGVMVMERTGNIFAVKEALGHKSIITTIWSYGHIKTQKMREATRLDGITLKFGKVRNKKRKKQSKKGSGRRRKSK